MGPSQGAQSRGVSGLLQGVIGVLFMGLGVFSAYRYSATGLKAVCARFSFQFQRKRWQYFVVIIFSSPG